MSMIYEYDEYEKTYEYDEYEKTWFKGISLILIENLFRPYNDR